MNPRYRKGSTVELNMTPLGKCVHAETYRPNGKHADYVLILHIRGEKPHSAALRGWLDEEVAVAQVAPEGT